MELRIKELLKERGMTAKQLGELAGLSNTGLYTVMWENKTTTETLQKFADILDVPVWELMVPCGVSGVAPTTSSSIVTTCPQCGARLKLNIKAEVL